MSQSVGRSAIGQMLVLFAFALVLLILAVGLVVDGGYAFSQRRAAQNAADFAAMAGTRIVGEALTGVPVGAGTAQNVEGAINSVLLSNRAQLVSAQYVSESGAVLGNVVGASSIPSGASGVTVNARVDWRPFFLGIMGVTSWSAGSNATALTPGSSTGGGVLPVGISSSMYDSLIQCPLTALDDCISQNLTPGVHNIPGGFGWLKFGSNGKCSGFGLGMTPDGCGNSQPFLDSQIGPPPNSHGCCTQVGLPGSADQIGSLPGNEWGDLTYYVKNQIPVWVPIWDTAGGNGANAYYHIVGFGAIVFTDLDKQHAKWLTGAAVGGLPSIPGHHYADRPGDPFKIGVTGAVYLVR